MMDLLMEVKDEEDEDIIDLLLVFFLAGHETSAHGILWTIIHLMDHPHKPCRDTDARRIHVD